MGLHENIRKFRKEKKMTQEQLAEQLGITVGAVSKWETGLSNPDISILPQLADLFGISIDVLFDYRITIQSATEVAEEIKDLWFLKEYDKAIEKAEEGLKRYPNHFELVYRTACVFYSKGMEQHEEKFLRRALELCYRASTLLSQNTNEDICELDIQRYIAGIYIQLGETEKALQQLKKCNYGGKENGTIGLVLMKAERAREALPYLSYSLIESFTELLRTAVGFANCYEQQGNIGEAITILEWVYTVTEGIKKPGQISYVDKLQTMLLSGLAYCYMDKGNYVQAKERLDKARMGAKLFDGAPTYSSDGIRFYCAKKYVFTDDFGETAMEAIYNVLNESTETAEQLREIWRELEDEEM